MKEGDLGSRRRRREPSTASTVIGVFNCCHGPGCHQYFLGGLLLASLALVLAGVIKLTDSSLLIY